ncbi:DUF1127 domain-containing protein [Martelella alba]|uniref:DUF1127 domain-containing protein n=1 Tax=Martelella alba TaxID=2590451 RepID=A0A506UIN7_9HYPH|nr:DUF1127 domain-containing protein [Martelella alba]TPW33177.1 DUF1127 domain-containing protein [Martelella alba]
MTTIGEDVISTQDKDVSRPGRWIGRAWNLYRKARRRRRQRRQLSDLEDYLLKDIGVSRRDARAEADKPFWR